MGLPLVGSSAFSGSPLIMSAVVVAFLQLTTRSYGQSFAPAPAPGTPGFIPIVVNNNPATALAPAPATTSIFAPSPALAPSAVATSIFNPQGSTPVGALPAATAPIQTPAVAQPAPAPPSIFTPSPAVAPAAVWNPSAAVAAAPGQPMTSSIYRPPTANLDLLSGYAADFLTSLNKEQLTAFLRVYFLSRMVGASMLDQRSSLALQRSGVTVDPADLRAIDTARTIPTSQVQMAGLENTGLGRVLSNYAARMRTASTNERLALAREYQNTVDTLAIPKGIKYALKHIV
ncbi:hypothetical protein RvY_03320-1 [Ramazzottius varieornatus]|uniref:Uncharacterized protein n=1 Tax=Ramazzottius varieornatus TaxID=947166 RepID=A0A1D1UMM1_RAMVA|nr:hypothetical protein RvY_03320-1 [Ramazzottius varieornatus]